jgi:hypothetical protein
MDAGDAFIASLLAERGELSAEEMVHAERVGQLQANLRGLEDLLADPSLSVPNRVAVSKQVTRVTNAIHRHMHELRQAQKRVDRQAAARPGPPAPAPDDAERAWQGGSDRPRLMDVVASSRERTARLRAAQRPPKEV